MGWKLFHTSSYYLSSDSRYWDESEKSCMQMDSHLVVMEAEQVSCWDFKASPGWGQNCIPCAPALE